MPKKIPQRQCCACREKQDKPCLVRVVRTPEGEVRIDLKGKMPGRGVYICKEAACFERAVKTRAIARALECDVPPDILDNLGTIVRGAGDG